MMLKISLESIKISLKSRSMPLILTLISLKINVQEIKWSWKINSNNWWTVYPLITPLILSTCPENTPTNLTQSRLKLSETVVHKRAPKEVAVERNLNKDLFLVKIIGKNQNQILSLIINLKSYWIKKRWSKNNFSKQSDARKKSKKN